jgi:hypothetical protein
MDAFISLIVQVFFCCRIWTLSKRLWWFCIILVVVSSIFFVFNRLLLVTFFFNSFLLLKQLGRYGLASRQVSCNFCDQRWLKHHSSQLHLESTQSSSQVYTYVFSEHTKLAASHN